MNAETVASPGDPCRTHSIARHADDAPLSKRDERLTAPRSAEDSFRRGTGSKHIKGARAASSSSSGRRRAHAPAPSRTTAPMRAVSGVVMT